MTPIEIVLSGSTTAQVEGRAFAFSLYRSRSGVVHRVARALLAEGHDPRTLVRVTRNGTTVFEEAPLGAWADVGVEESDRVSVRLRKYRPWSGSERVGGGDRGEAEELDGALA